VNPEPLTRRRGLARAASGLIVWTALVVLVAWAVGRVFNDRWHWSQYFFWIPTIAALGGSTVLTLMSVVLAGAAHQRRRLALVVGLCVLVGWGWALIVEWRVLSSRPGSSVRPFRVIHWNASGNLGDSWDASLIQQDADILVIVPAGYQRWDRIVGHYAPFAPAMWRERFTVLTKHPMIRVGSMTLGIDPGLGFDPRQQSTRRLRDPGRAMFIEFDTRASLGRSLVVWCLDLPSDVSLHRRVITREAAQAIAAFRGPVDVKGPDGVWAQMMLDVQGFPPADLIVGDMNMPRGSGAMGALTSGLASAYDLAGTGPSATWPYGTPLWTLDQAFVAPWLGVQGYAVINLGGGTHRAQRVDLRRGGAPGTLTP
jgi:hypothetical protein